MNAKLEYASARYREAREIAMQAESTARRAQNARALAERLLVHHLAVLVEQGGRWADTPEQGTTLACAQSAVSQWEEARTVEARACATADLAHAQVNDLQRDVLDASSALDASRAR